jgi:DNA-directed RNA polymerase specialized sigma24 family protein
VEKRKKPALTDPDDVTRFTELYERYRARVFAYAVSKVGRELAEEIASDVFLIAWQRIADLPDQPLPWLLVTWTALGFLEAVTSGKVGSHGIQEGASR